MHVPCTRPAVHPPPALHRRDLLRTVIASLAKGILQATRSVSCRHGHHGHCPRPVVTLGLSKAPGACASVSPTAPWTGARPATFAEPMSDAMGATPAHSDSPPPGITCRN